VVIAPGAYARCRSDQHRHAVENPFEPELQLDLDVVVIVEHARGDRPVQRREPFDRRQPGQHLPITGHHRLAGGAGPEVGAQRGHVAHEAADQEH
jgi:hypothetical protein